MLDFENKIASALKDTFHSYDTDGTVFLAAVSGGADSIAMLCALSVLVPKDRVFCLHVEHGLRPAQESRGDAEFVRDFCEKHGIDFRIETIAPGKIASFARRKGSGIEAAARYFRRKAFLKEAARLGENTVIITAHTKDDALELTLMRILRGAGQSGLAAMPVKRGKFFRPLLSVNRADVISYLKEKKLLWREDSTNADEKFLRNKVRRRLVPLLNEFFPFWEKGLAGMAETQSFAAGFINEESHRRIYWERENGAFFTDSKNFFSQPQIIREEALFQGINLFLSGKRAVSIKRSVIRHFCAGYIKNADLGLLRLKQESAQIVIYPARNNSYETGFSLLINKPGLYNLNRACVHARTNMHIKVCIEALCSSDWKGTEKVPASFFTVLPLVFRKIFKDDLLVSNGKKIKGRECASQGKNLISAVDTMGTAAFINGAEVLFSRDFVPQECGDSIYLVRVFNLPNRNTIVISSTGV